MATENEAQGSEPNWAEVCNPERLEFRAACNAVLPVEMQPLTVKKQLRISRLPDSRKLFDTLWAGLPTEKKSLTEFFEALVRNPQWQTLVREQVVRKSGRDFFSKETLEVSDKVFGFLGELFGSEAPAAVRIMSYTTTILVATFGARTINPEFPKNVIEPIRIALLGESEPIAVSIVPKLATNSLPLYVDIQNPMPPIALRFESEPKAIPVNVRMNVKQDKAAAPIIANQSSGINIDALREEIKGVKEALRETSERAEESISKKFAESQRINALYQESVNVLVPVNGSQFLFPAVFKDDLTTTALMVCVKNINSRRPKDGQLVKVLENTSTAACVPDDGIKLKLLAADDVKLVGREWRITFVEVQERFFGRDAVRLKLTPQQPIKPTVANTSAHQAARGEIVASQ